MSYKKCFLIYLQLNPHMKKSLAIDIADFELMDINSTVSIGLFEEIRYM